MLTGDEPRIPLGGSVGQINDPAFLDETAQRSLMRT